MKLEEKALCITFYDKMDHLCKKVLHEMGIQMPTVSVSDGVNEGNLMDFLSDYIDKGVELFICRGVLANILREKFPVSVLEIKYSYLDIFQKLLPFQNSGRKLGCLEADDFYLQVCNVAKLLGLEVIYYEVRQLSDFWDGYQSLRDQGVDLIIGGSWGHIYSQSLDIPYLAVEYSEEGIRNCLEEVLALFENLYCEEEKRDYLSVLLNHSTEGIISVDTMGMIKQINQTAKSILNLASFEIPFSNIGDVFPKYKKPNVLCDITPEENLVINYQGKRILLTRIPLFVNQEVTGVVFFLSEEKRLLEAERQMRLAAVSKGLTAKHHFDEITSKSDLMTETLDQAKLFSSMESTILLTGETGTGKEFFAQSIHNASRRAQRPFVSVNCAAFSSSLLESELFGYAEGAFTGARRNGKAGIFEMAHGGTIFLDEIGEMDLSVQSKLLRVIQEREVMRLGDDRIIPVDVRIIAATNRDLKKESMEGRFRLDLYYRINVLGLTLPPMRERKEDLEPMVHNLIQEKNTLLGCRVTGIDKQIIRALEQYDWPGNIRELSNMIEKLVVITQSGQIRYHAVEKLLPVCTHAQPAVSPKTCTLEEMEQQLIQERLLAYGNNKTKAAQSLGIGQATLFRKINRYHLSPASDLSK